MKYFEEFGKKLTYHHCIKIKGDTVWNIFEFNVTPFSNWLREPVETWLQNIEPMKRHPRLPLWFPGNGMIPAWKAWRPYTVLRFKSENAGTMVAEEENVADIRFFRKEDAMKFKLTWA